MSLLSYTSRTVQARVKSTARDLFGTFYGRGLKNPPLVDVPKHALFICKGNVCRSPFAEKYFLQLTKRLGFAECSASSMGMEVSKNLPPPAEALLAAAELGVSLDEHRSRKIDGEAIEFSDIIIVMEALQLIALRESYQQFQHKIFLLPLFAQVYGASPRAFSLYNIPDPYGKSLEEFRVSFNAIRKSLDGFFQAVAATPRPTPNPMVSRS